MPVSVANEVIKHGGVDDVQQPGPCVIRRHFLHCFAIALVILPSVEAQIRTGPDISVHLGFPVTISDKVYRRKTAKVSGET